MKELKDFIRVPFKAGEKKTVKFKISAEKLAFYDKNMEWVVEPGTFKIMVGVYSDDNGLISKIMTVE